MTMEAQKSHRRLSASWRSRTAGGVIIVHLWRPENQEHWRLRAEKDAQAESKFFLPLPFWSIQTLSRLADAHPRWGGWSLLSQGTNVFQRQPHRHAHKCRPALRGTLSAVKVTHKINHRDPGGTGAEKGMKRQGRYKPGFISHGAEISCHRGRDCGPLVLSAQVRTHC